MSDGAGLRKANHLTRVASSVARRVGRCSVVESDDSDAFTQFTGPMLGAALTSASCAGLRCSDNSVPVTTRRGSPPAAKLGRVAKLAFVCWSTSMHAITKIAHKPAESH